MDEEWNAGIMELRDVLTEIAEELEEANRLKKQELENKGILQVEKEE